MPRISKGSRAEYDKAYRSKNRARVYAKQAQWRSENRELLKAKGAKRRREKRAQCLINGARTRCRNKSILFALEGFEPELQRRIDLGVCELSGAKFDLSPGRKANSPSLDRIDPQKGYIPSNVRVICHALNTALGDWGVEGLAPIIASWLQKGNAVNVEQAQRFIEAFLGVTA